LIDSAVQALQAKDGTIKKHRPKGSGLQAADLICAAERSESLIQTEMAMQPILKYAQKTSGRPQNFLRKLTKLSDFFFAILRRQEP
jgi:hypothetical protein